jgi:hypothetical protein
VWAALEDWFHPQARPCRIDDELTEAGQAPTSGRGWVVLFPAGIVAIRFRRLELRDAVLVAGQFRDIAVQLDLRRGDRGMAHQVGDVPQRDAGAEGLGAESVPGKVENQVFRNSSRIAQAPVRAGKVLDGPVPAFS